MGMNEGDGPVVLAGHAGLCRWWAPRFEERNRAVMRGSFEVNVVQPGLCWPVPDLPWIILYHSIIILYHSILASIIRLPFSDHSNPPLNHSLIIRRTFDMAFHQSLTILQPFENHSSQRIHPTQGFRYDPSSIAVLCRILSAMSKAFSRFRNTSRLSMSATFLCNLLNACVLFAGKQRFYVFKTVQYICHPAKGRECDFPRLFKPFVGTERHPAAACQFCLCHDAASAFHDSALSHRAEPPAAYEIKINLSWFIFYPFLKNIAISAHI